MSKFKRDNSEKYRTEESQRVRLKYPEKIPVICEKNPNCKDTPTLIKSKYLVPLDLTVGQFMFIIRKKMVLSPEKSIYLFVNNKILSGSQIVSYIYEHEKDPDGFLYIGYTSENTFGSL